MHLAALARSCSVVASWPARTNRITGQVFTDQRHEVVEPLAVITQRSVHGVFYTIRPLPVLLQVRYRVAIQYLFLITKVKFHFGN